MAFHQPGSLLVSHVSLSLSPILAPTLFLGKMMKRENRGLGEENEKEYFFFLFGFSFKHDLCIFHCLVELVDFRYPGFASSNFLSVPTFGFIYTLNPWIGTGFQLAGYPLVYSQILLMEFA
jgi:hypothetical protein